MILNGIQAAAKAHKGAFAARAVAVYQSFFFLGLVFEGESLVGFSIMPAFKRSALTVSVG